jgi:transcription initiation factor TFIID TATA-box-binding protein
MVSEDEKGKVTIANIVSSGKLNVELDLASVAEDLKDQPGIESVEHSRRQGNRLLVRFDEIDTLGIIAPTGVYVFTGADSRPEIHKAKNIMLSGLTNLGIISDPDPPDEEIIDSLEIQNFVFTGTLERDLDLNALAIDLGLENTEYEPEQFPGLVYRPLSGSCTLLIFASGKVVITGVTSEKTAREELTSLNEEIDTLLNGRGESSV